MEEYVILFLKNNHKTEMQYDNSNININTALYNTIKSPSFKPISSFLKCDIVLIGL